VLGLRGERCRLLTSGSVWGDHPVSGVIRVIRALVEGCERGRPAGVSSPRSTCLGGCLGRRGAAGAPAQRTHYVKWTSGEDRTRENPLRGCGSDGSTVKRAESQLNRFCSVRRTVLGPARDTSDGISSVVGGLGTESGQTFAKRIERDRSSSPETRKVASNPMK
jgi:hypothetical protein